MQPTDRGPLCSQGFRRPPRARRAAVPMPGRCAPSTDAAYALARQLLDDHVPIDGIGIQGHLDTQYGWNPRLLREDIERYASLGLKVAITEADVRTFVNNATDQVPTNSMAQFAQPFEFSEMLKAGLAVPEFISFTVWGFTDLDSWVPGFFTGEGFLRRQPQP
jgi:endo-1,4-beta-xylanase